MKSRPAQAEDDGWVLAGNRITSRLRHKCRHCRTTYYISPYIRGDGCSARRALSLAADGLCTAAMREIVYIAHDCDSSVPLFILAQT
eukprot:IDg3681t1